MQFTITKPDDWHLHLRDGAALKSVVGFSAQQFSRAIIMPNLTPPVTTTSQALEYRQRILEALPQNSVFEPLMTLYLTEQTSPEEIEKAANSDFVKACKLYPAGATTNSDSGVKDIKNIYSVLTAMQQHNLVLCVHGEVVTDNVDIFDRESTFINTVLKPLIEDFPRLRIVLEHITTAEAAKFVEKASENIAATITPQHLMFNRNHILVGGIKPHYYCLPILKRDRDREELVRAATSGNPKFFLGTDSAPHAKSAKENACGCAGMFSAHAAMELYIEIFETADALDQLEGFASFYGADFYQLPRNKDKITFEKNEWQVPKSYPFADTEIIPMRADEPLSWKIQS